MSSHFTWESRKHILQKGQRNKSRPCSENNYFEELFRVYVNTGEMKGEKHIILYIINVYLV